MKKYKSPINRSILIGCSALILVLSLLLSLQTYRSVSNAMYEQYNARLRDVATSVTHLTDADDLQQCLQTGVSSPKRDALQQQLNRMVDDYELFYLFIAVPVDENGNAQMVNAVSATSEAERAEGAEDLALLEDVTEYYTEESLAPYAAAWYRDDISYFEETSEWGACYTGCVPLKNSEGVTFALVCAEYNIDEMQKAVANYVIRNVLLIVCVCVFFGALLAWWLRKNVTGPIRALEQSALRFARMTHEVKDAEQLSFDAEGIEANSEVRLLIDAMVKLSEEMKSQVGDAASAEERAHRAEEENARLSEKAEAAIKIAELTQSVTSLLTNMPGLTYSKDADNGKYLACNQAYAEFAHKADPKEVVGKTDFELFDKKTAEHFAEDDKKALSMDGPYVFYEDVLDAEGNPRQFQTTKLKFTDAAGRLCTLGMCLDFTELMRAKQETLEAKEAYERAQSINAIYAHIANAFSTNYSQIYYVDLETDDYTTYSSGTQDSGTNGTKGTDFFRASRQNALTIIYEEDQDEFLKAFTKENILRTVDDCGVFTLSYRLMMDGKPSYASLKATRRPDDPRHLIIDVSNNEDQDLRSDLTGLYMEASFFVHGRDMLKTRSEGWCVIAMDLEHFKLFNEWYGREAGDQLLRQIGERLAAAEGTENGLAGYMGQDDFCLLFPYNEEKIRSLYSDIHGMIMERGTSIGFMPAFGVCMTDAENSIEELYDRASLASHHAKENYHTRIRVFEESMYKKTERDYQILSDFQKAVKEHELFIMLQPQCLIDTGKIVGAESLVRWKKKDEQKMVSPGIFVPVLEQYGFVTELDKFVWEEVCAWQRKWIDSGHTALPVSVNVSQIDIFSIDVPDYFDALIKKYDLPADAVKVEITESAYVGDGAVIDTVKRLRDKGFLVLMDDFGSGYSSLNMLRSINVDIIKLDAKFLRMNSADRKGVHILESIVNMAKTMGVPIIVEGVETKEETDFISNLGCRYVQGYFFYRPMPVADFEALIGDEENIDTGGFVFKVKEEFHTREFLDQNVFSDVMLNNILGPVAFFLLHGEDLDCIRYNQQFYNEVDSDQFDLLLHSAQRLVLEEDLPILYGLLEQAMHDPLGGAADVVRVRRKNGVISQFRLQFFFLDEDENGMRFYGSVHDITHLDKLHSQLRMISRLSNDEVILVRKRDSGLLYQVSVHGLEDAFAASREMLEHELNEGEFRKRMDDKTAEDILSKLRQSGTQMQDFSPAFKVRGAGGKEVLMQYRIDAVQDKSSGVEYLLVLRRAEK